MYEKEAGEILELVGGKSNVRSLVHCATRLRFELKDEETALARKDELEAKPYVLKVLRSGGQYQVVIGPAVHDYWVALMALGGLSEDDADGGSAGDGSGGAKTSPVDAVLKFFSGAFSPIIPVMSGAGMLKALLTLLVTLGVLAETDPTYLVVAAAGNACFYFLPVLLGYTASKQLGSNPYVGAAIGAALLEPNFTQLIGQAGTTFLGLPLQAVDYNSTVFPIFITVVVYAFLDRAVRKHMNKDLQFFLAPMIDLLFVVPFAALVFGPFGNNVGDAIAAGIQWLFETSTFLAGLVLGAVYPYLVVLGLHWGLAPISLQNVTLTGGDYIEGACVCACWAQMGIALGCYLKAKKGSRVKDVAGPCFVTGIMAGVTEPILYGLVTNYKRLMVNVSIASALGAAWNAVWGVTMDQFVFHNVFSVATLCYSPMWAFLVGIAISFAAAVGLTLAWKLPEDAERDFMPRIAEVEGEAGRVPSGAPAAPGAVAQPGAVAARETSGHEVAVVAPADGELIPLSAVADAVFSSGVMGPGVAVRPTGDVVCAPAAGTVTMLFDTKHAVGITTPEGIELLVHIGLDTVELGGQGFEALVSQGDAVAAGQPMMRLDRAFFESCGVVLDTPVVVTNADAVQAIVPAENGPVKAGDPAMKIVL